MCVFTESCSRFQVNNSHDLQYHFQRNATNFTCKMRHHIANYCHMCYTYDDLSRVTRRKTVNEVTGEEEMELCCRIAHL